MNEAAVERRCSSGLLEREDSCGTSQEHSKNTKHGQEPRSQRPTRPESKTARGFQSGATRHALPLATTVGWMLVCFCVYISVTELCLLDVDL